MMDIREAFREDPDATVISRAQRGPSPGSRNAVGGCGGAGPGTADHGASAMYGASGTYSTSATYGSAAGPHAVVHDADGPREFGLLRGALVLGREPESRAAALGARPVRVQPQEAGVSKAHVAIQRHGDLVLVTDLGSTNGTAISPAGAAPFRLRSGEQVPLPSGARVDLGSGVWAQAVWHGG